MKALAALALAAVLLPSAAAAETRIVKAHGQTAPALMCMLDHLGDRCKVTFAGGARQAAQRWLFWSPNRDFALGPLQSAEYAYTQSQNAYTTKFLYGRTADVYYAKYQHQDFTFYIVPPGPDGKILYMLIRGGRPEDEKTEPVGLSRIR